VFHINILEQHVQAGSTFSKLAVNINITCTVNSTFSNLAFLVCEILLDTMYHIKFLSLPCTVIVSSLSFSLLAGLFHEVDLSVFVYLVNFF